MAECLSGPLLGLSPLGSDAEIGVAPGYASPSSCPLPRDRRGGRKEDLCQMSALHPPNQPAATSCRRHLPSPEPGHPRRPPPAHRHIGADDLLVLGSG